MATTKLADLTEALPLLDLDNDPLSPTYNQYAKGRNTARDIRVDLLGQLFARGTLTTAHGVLAHTWVGDATTGYFREFRATAQGTPSRVLTFGAGRLITPRAGQGVYLCTQESDLNGTMPSADGSLPRIDRVFAMAYDKGAFGTDADHGPQLLCITGTPNASPVAPTLPTDAEPVCRVFRRAGASGDQIAQADITDERIGASLSREARPLLGGDSLSDPGAVHGELRLRTGSFVPAAIPLNSLVDRWDAIGGVWVGTNRFKLSSRITSAGTIAPGATRTGAQIVIPDPGWVYRVSAGGTARCSGAGSLGANELTMQLRVGVNAPATAYDGTLAATGTCPGVSTNAYVQAEQGTTDNAFAGSQTVYKLIKNGNGTATVTLVGGTEVFDKFDVWVDPV